MSLVQEIFGGRAVHLSNGPMVHVLWLMARHGSELMKQPSKDGGKDGVTVLVTYSVSSLHSVYMRET